MAILVIDRNLQFTGPFTPRAKTDTLVLHHAAAMSCTVEDIHRWHLANGWLGIGYHYFVSKLGGIYLGRPENVMGAHAESHNDHTIGICAEGDFEKETMPTPQKEAIIALIKDILTRYPGLAIKGHRDLNATLCPGQHYPFNEIVSAVLGTPILGTPQATVAQAQEWARNRGAHQRFINIAPVYWEYGEKTGIRPEVLYAQSAKETAFGRYGGAVRPEQNNWAGIKTATAAGDRPEDHETFPTPEDGVRAHFNHLAAYVGLEPIGQPHGRYYIVRDLSWAGSVRYVEELGGKWAPNPDYGKSIVRDYLADLLATEDPVIEQPQPPAKDLASLEERVGRLEEIIERIREVLNS